MTTPTFPSYAGHRFPAEVISHAVWLYFRFPLSLRMVEEMLAARGIIVSHKTIRQSALKFGQNFANLGVGCPAPETNGTWTRLPSKLLARNTGCGARWTRRASCSTSWCRAGETNGPPNGPCASC